MAAPSSPYSVVRISGLKNSERRNIVLLTSHDGRLNAQADFGRIDSDKKRSRELRARFDYWIDGGTQVNWFHGWDLQEYKDCFCFKVIIKTVKHRFYGFVCHPQPGTRPRFELCVLCFFDAKPGAETDKYYLREAMRLSADRFVKAAIGQHFPDIKESKPCVH